MTDRGVTYTAPCPTCTRPAQWTGWTSQHHNPAEGLAQTSTVTVTCTHCGDRPPIYEEVIPVNDYSPTQLVGYPLCAHGRSYAGCSICGTRRAAA